MAKVTQAEYNKAKAAVESAMKSGQVSKTDEGGYKINTGEKAGTTISNKGVVTAPSSGITGGGATSSSTSVQDGSATGLTDKNTSSINDIYGDVSGNRQTDKPMDFQYKGQQAIAPELNKYGASAMEMEKAKSGSIAQRNDIIASNLYNQGITDEKEVRKFLESQAGFTDSTKEQQDNTVGAITTRLSSIINQEGTKTDTTGDTTDGTDMTKLSSMLKDYNADGIEDKEGYYYDKNTGEYYKAYGYDSWSDALKNEYDRLPDDKKKEVSNMGAQALQEYLKLGDDYLRTKEYQEKQHGIAEDLYENQHRQATIQMEQTLRKAEEGYNNLKQNWQYLGNMGMPGVSATRIEAIGDAITEAKKTLGEIQELEALKMDAIEMQWDQQVLQYSKQIDDLTNDLKWRTSQEFVDAINKFNSAELEGNLDTIDGITAFRRELLDQMDKNLSGITNQSLNQMQYITQQYQDVADKMYEYNKNKNEVNKDMSMVKGYYVDGNGNAILNDKGEPIEVPQEAPMDPIFDKESGRLITFSYDENGNIKANIQQVWEGGANSMNSQIVSALSMGASVSDILKKYPNADIDMIQKLAGIVTADYTKDGMPTKWQGKSYTAVSKDGFIDKVKSFVSNQKVGTNGGQCGHFVNNYLESLGVSRMFEDPITQKTKNINSQVPSLGSVVIMNSESSPQYGHVGIVIGLDEQGNMKILQSNKAGEEKVFVSNKNSKDSNILGYFDPTKSVEDYNNQMQTQVSAGTSGGVNKEGFKQTMTGYYDKFLSGKFTTEDTKQYNTPQFQKELEAYKQYKEAQVTDYTRQVLKSLYRLQDIGFVDYQNASLGIPRTDGYTYKKDFDTLMANYTLQSLTNAKASGVSFGALSDHELGLIGNANASIDFGLPRGEFNNRVKDLIQGLERGLIENGAGDTLAELKSEYSKNNGGKIPGGNL